MFRKLVPLVIVSLWGVVVMPLPQKANASTPLTRAVVKKLHNWVQLMPRNRPKRRARRSDRMNPGDGLATGRASLADLRFNDGSLARIGERAVFRFLPRTRTFRLSNGTVLLLIPPGQGRTKIRTRSAAATIRGSALFVRYDEQTDTTVVGSLTNSGIEVSNKDESRSQVLKAGQLIVVVKGRIQGLYNFDLRTFYETSDLVRGLNLTVPNNTVSSDPAMASVQAETSEALTKQVPVNGENVVKNPSFIKLSAGSSSKPSEQVPPNGLPVDALVDTGQVVITTPKKDQDKSPSNNTNPTIPQAPAPANPKPQPTTTNGGKNPTVPQTPPSPPTTPKPLPSPTTPINGGKNPTVPQTPPSPPTTPKPLPSP
ncbi:MAG: FecR family protein, partial [Cyanobacteria bacterium J06621_15]